MDLSEEQNNLIKKIALENNLSDYKLVKKEGSLRGDNFLGIITAITLTDEEKTLNLILKSAHQNEDFRKSAPVHGMYQREIYMYNKVFQEFKIFQEDNNIANPFEATAKMYNYILEDKQECLIMEDLKKSGYKMWDKKIPMNKEHIKSVLIEYAKFHAISFAMKHKNPKLFEEITQPLKRNVFADTEILNGKEKLKKYIRVVIDNGLKAVGDEPELIEFLKEVETKLYDLFEKDLENEEFKLVINHGDCWCNNFLFKYEDSNNNKAPVSLRILDWQITSLASPVTDLSYFFLTNSSQEIFDDHSTYFQLYYDTLKFQLEDFGCDIEKIFPYKVYRQHLDKFMLFGVHMGIMILKVVECLPEEAPDFAEDGGFENSLNFNVSNMDSYKKRLSSLLRFVQKNKFV